MALGRAAVVPAAPAPKVRFFVGDKQVFAKQTELRFNSGDQLELFGTRYRVLDSAPVFNLEDETVTTDVRLTDSFATVAATVEEN